MPKATRYTCSGCGNAFVLELFLQQDSQLCCLFCNSQASALAEVRELKAEVARLKDELQEVRRLVQVDEAVTADRGNQEDDSQNVASSDDGFQVVRNGRKANVHSLDSATLALSNRFAALQEDKPEQDVILVGDSLVRGQGYEFCRNKANRKHRCYPGRKIEDITERVDYLVENSKEETLFVTLVGTNNLHRESATDIVAKYRDMMKEFVQRRRRIAVCGIIPRYDVGPAIFRKMSVVNRQLEALCRQEGTYFFDLWHHFCSDRTLYARDGIHLNCVGKARLGRVIGECVADIPRPPQTGNGSNDKNEDTDSAASEVVVANVIDNNAAPDSDEAHEAVSVVRQDEAGTSSVPETNEQETQGADFH